VLEGRQLNSIVHLQIGLLWSAIGSQDISQTGELTDHWDFFGNPSDFKPGPRDSLVGIPYFKGRATNMPSACTTAAASIGATASLKVRLLRSGQVGVDRSAAWQLRHDAPELFPS
jgi:hypothetical protein